MASKFQQRHYEFLASFLAYERSVSTGVSWDKDTERTKTIDGLARLLATRLEQDNPRFKRSHFLEACDVEDHGPTYEDQLAAARKLLADEGRKALRPHASTGRDCGCGTCFCCAASEVFNADLEGTRCECGAAYNPEIGGYNCAA